MFDSCEGVDDSLGNYFEILAKRVRKRLEDRLSNVLKNGSPDRTCQNKCVISVYGNVRVFQRIEDKPFFLEQAEKNSGTNSFSDFKYTLHLSPGDNRIAFIVRPPLFITITYVPDSQRYLPTCHVFKCGFRSRIIWRKRREKTS